MGKPAARLGDLTAHGGTVMLGNPTIMMGKMPASTLGDMHVCPMCTGPVPHVGGPITLGSMGVIVGKKPSARISDMATCVGPPSMNALGCFTVLIGEAGSGSSAGSAGTAAEAQAAKKKGPKAIGAFPLGEAPGPTESHEIKVEFVDSAGKPLTGVRYAIKDPDKKDLIGASTMDGAALHGGYAKKGSYELSVHELKNAKWKKPKVKMGDEAEFSVEADVAEGITDAHVAILESRGPLRHVVAVLELKVEGKKVQGKWKPVYSELHAPAPDPAAGGVEPPPPQEKPTYDFICVVDGMVAVSDTLQIADILEIELLDADGKDIANHEYELTLPGGEIRTGKLDGSGKAKFEDLEPGGAEVRFPGMLGSGEPQHVIVMDEVVITAGADEGDGAEASGEPAGGEAAKPEEDAKKKDGGKVLKNGDHGPIVEELNIRLAGFGGGHPTIHFTDETEKALKKFQKDWMKETSPSGVLDEKTAEAFDAFTKYYHFDFTQTKCKCEHLQEKAQKHVSAQGKKLEFETCKGYGRQREIGKSNMSSSKAEVYNRYEYPGMHRSILWALKGVMFLLEKNHMSLNQITSGYRCWADNQTYIDEKKETKKIIPAYRTSTNHMGKALDISINVTAGGHTHKGEIQDCDRAREILKAELNWVLNWNPTNHFSMEPSVSPPGKNAAIATNWVHFDVREFKTEYLLEKYFCKTKDDFLGAPLVDLLTKD